MVAFATVSGIDNTVNGLDAAITFAKEMEREDTDLHGQPNENIKFRHGELSVDGEAMPVTEHAYHQILQRLGIPSTFADRCSDRLIGLNVREMMREKRDAQWRVRTRVQNGQRYIRAVVTDRYKPLTDSGVLSRIAEEHDDNQFKSWEVKFTDDMMRSVGILDGMDIKPSTNVGDVTNTGIEIINGTTGLKRFGIGMYLYRLACSNGLVVPEMIAGMSKRHVGNTFYNQYNVSFNQVIGSIEQVQAAWSNAASRKMKDIKHSVLNRARLAAEQSLGRKEVRDIFEKQMDPENNTAYDLLNALTYRAHTVSNLSDRHSLEAAAGQLLLVA